MFFFHREGKQNGLTKEIECELGNMLIRYIPTYNSSTSLYNKLIELISHDMFNWIY